MTTMATSKAYTVFITGAASGIGRCFAQHYFTQPNTLVIAADINKINIPATPGPCGKQEGDYESKTKAKLIELQIDTSSTNSIEAAVKSLISTHKIANIDLLIHSAGIRGLVSAIEAQNPENVAASETLQAMNATTMLRTYQINTLGTFTLLQSLLKDNLLHAKDFATSAKVVIMTSRMGSISYNTAGGSYAYRASKAALNAIVKSMSIDVPDVVFALVHPGRVETGLTWCREEGAIEVEESVGDMLGIINGLNREDSGRYMDRFGKDIGW